MDIEPDERRPSLPAERGPLSAGSQMPVTNIQLFGVPPLEEIERSPSLPEKDLQIINALSGSALEESHRRYLLTSASYPTRELEPGSMVLGRRSLELLVHRVEFFNIDIPLLRLHVPRIFGCEAIYKATTKQEGDWKVTFMVLGAGGSLLSKFDQEHMQLTKITNNCLEVVQQGKVKVEVGKLIYNGKTTPYLGMAFSIAEIKPDMIFRTLDSHLDACNVPIEQLTSLGATSAMHPLPPIDLRGRPKDSLSIERSFTITEKITTATDVSPKLGPLGDYFSIGFTVTQSTEESLGLSYNLAPGVAYYPYKPGGQLSMEICWAVRQAEA